MNNAVSDLVAMILVLAGLTSGVTPGVSLGAAPAPPAMTSLSSGPTCPLTGVDAGSTDLSRPVHAVKIDNAPKARPQVGMPQADVVYEELVEGGLTRFLVVLHCQSAPRLGPIRSARLVDPDLLIPYAPVLFGYSGAAPPVLTKVRSTPGVINLVHGGNGPAYQRSGARPAPHNLYTSSDALLARPAAQGVKGPPSTGFNFDPGLLAGSPAPGGNGVDLTYSRASSASYAYDSGTQKYLRSQGGRPHNDESGAQLSATNVLVFKVPVQIVGGSPNIGVTGEGEATILRGGQAVQGKWRRASVNDHFTLIDGSGQPVYLAPGNIWINLVPSDRSVSLK